MATGLGFLPGLSDFIQGKPVSGKNLSDTLANALPAWAVVPAFCFVVVYFILRIVITNEDVKSRAALAKGCARGMDDIHDRLLTALENRAPRAEINKIAEDMLRLVDIAVRSPGKPVWPFQPRPPKGVKVKKAVDDMVDAIRNDYMAKWAPEPTEEDRE